MCNSSARETVFGASALDNKIRTRIMEKGGGAERMLLAESGKSGAKRILSNVSGPSHAVFLSFYVFIFIKNMEKTLHSVANICQESVQRRQGAVQCHSTCEIPSPPMDGARRETLSVPKNVSHDFAVSTQEWRRHRERGRGREEGISTHLTAELSAERYERQAYLGSRTLQRHRRKYLLS